jgi:hypothetical protein
MIAPERPLGKGFLRANEVSQADRSGDFGNPT